MFIKYIIQYSAKFIHTIFFPKCLINYNAICICNLLYSVFFPMVQILLMLMNDDRKDSLHLIYKTITNYKNKCKSLVVTCKINYFL